MNNNLKINKFLFLQNYQIYESSNKKGLNILHNIFKKKYKKHK